MADVIVIEDDPTVCQLLVKVMEMQGHAVRAFSDAQPALDSVDFGAVDLVITDLGMPTPGEVAIKAIRALGIQTPILVATGRLDSGGSSELQAYGHLQILRKPFHLDDLLRAVDALMAR